MPNNAKAQYITSATYKKPLCLPPPVCARPTISSLCKMNRTFSLNNIFVQQSQPQQIVLLPVDYDDKKTQQRKASESSASTSSQGSTTPGHIQPTPLKRRTPRNAEEFLEAAGIDSQVFVNKGYYIGSMFNLNECTLTPHRQQQQQPKHAQTLNRKPKDVKRHSTFKRSSSLKRDQSDFKSFGNTPALSMANLNLFNNDADQNDIILFDEYINDQTSPYLHSNDEYEVLSQYSNQNGKPHQNQTCTISSCCSNSPSSHNALQTPKTVASNRSQCLHYSEPLSSFYNNTSSTISNRLPFKFQQQHRTPSAPRSLNYVQSEKNKSIHNPISLPFAWDYKSCNSLFSGS